MRLTRLVGPTESDAILDALCDAFHDYPVMRFVLGDRPDYAPRLRTLIGLFTQARVARGDLVLGVDGPGGRLAAAALVNLPGDPTPAPWFEEFREQVWRELGPAERARYELYGTVSHAHDPTEPHHHLGMIGVRGEHQGEGLGRALMEAVQAAAEADSASLGVSLTTEVARNVALYEHFGYRVVGHSRVAPTLETWSLFRARGA